MHTTNFFLQRNNLYSFFCVLCQFLSSMLEKKMMLRQEVKHRLKYVRSLKCIDDELWCCHDAGLTVYSFDLKKVKNLLDNWVNSVASLDVKSVVIASSSGLSTCSKQGL